MGALEQLADGWWSWIAPLSLQVAALVLAFALIERCVGRRLPTPVRAALAWAVLVRLALPPWVSSPVGIAAALELGDPARDLAGTPAAPILLPMFTVWAAGLALALACAIRRLARDHRAWTAGLRAAPADVQALAGALSGLLPGLMPELLSRRGRRARPPEILVSSTARNAAAIGVVRPRIVLPAPLALGGAGERLRHVLLHELAHVARRDVLAALVWELARIVFWFHPCVHLAARHAATLREIACDELAARASGSGASYRRTLLAAARTMLPAAPAAHAGFLQPAAQILSRIEALDRPLGRHARRDRAAGVLCFVAVAIGCVPLAARPAIDPGARPAAPYALDELQGCLRKRYAVLAAISASEAETSSRP